MSYCFLPSLTTAIFNLSLGFLPIGLFTVILSSLTTPWHINWYSLVIECSFSCSAKLLCALLFLAYLKVQKYLCLFYELIPGLITPFIDE